MNRRSFLATATALSLSGRAFAAIASLDASASRTPDRSHVRIDWSDKARPVTIFQSSDPDGGAGTARAIKAATAGTAEVEAAISPRPYFRLTTRDGGQTRVAERLLPLEGGRNFRDLGGYRSADGRQVRWGRIYRSGVMSGLTAGETVVTDGQMSLAPGMAVSVRGARAAGGPPRP